MLEEIFTIRPNKVNHLKDFYFSEIVVRFLRGVLYVTCEENMHSDTMRILSAT